MRLSRLAGWLCPFAVSVPLLAQTVVDPTLHVELVVSGLSAPTTMAFVGDDDILVLQKNNGQVRRVKAGVLDPVPVLDVPVANASERGLLGIALDPDFVNNRRVFLYYTEGLADGGTALANRVYRYRWDEAALVEPVLVLDLPVTPGPNHDGGIVAFGPDDHLYTVIGELNRNGKLQNFPLGPDPDDTGVILRTRGDGTTPPDNPFYDESNPLGMSRYYSYGVRNSFGMAFDPLTGLLWDTENGPGNYDEINQVLPGSNSGWEQIMGPDERDPQGLADLWLAPRAFYSDPEFSWAATVAPTAIAFPRSRKLGCGFPGDLIVGDNNCGQLYRFKLNSHRDGFEFSSLELQDLVADNGLGRCNVEQSEILFGGGFGVITDAKNGPDGRLYVVSLTLGAIYRIVRTAGSVPDRDADEVADECDCEKEDASAFAPTLEIPRLRLSGTAPALGWDAQQSVTGPGTTYGVVSGALSALSADGGFASSCLLAAGRNEPRYVDARPDPEAGEGFYYLVRASNACGAGTFGSGSESPDPRDLLDAQITAACP